MSLEEYKFICWLNGEVPDAKIIRDLLRKKHKRDEVGSNDENKQEI